MVQTGHTGNRSERNFRVENLRALLDRLQAEECGVDDRIEETEHGRFGWVMDPEGNRIEPWEPPPEEASG